MINNMRKLPLIAIFSVIFLSLFSSVVYGEDFTVFIQKGAADKNCAQANTCFSQPELTVCVGSQVTWINNDVGQKNFKWEGY